MLWGLGQNLLLLLLRADSISGYAQLRPKASNLLCEHQQGNFRFGINARGWFWGISQYKSNDPSSYGKLMLFRVGNIS